MSRLRRSKPGLDELIEQIIVDCYGEDEDDELIATCQRNGRRYEIALLDIDLNADPATSNLLAGYRRWIRE